MWCEDGFWAVAGLCLSFLGDGDRCRRFGPLLLAGDRERRFRVASWAFGRFSSADICLFFSCRCLTSLRTASISWLTSDKFVKFGVGVGAA